MAATKTETKIITVSAKEAPKGLLVCERETGVGFWDNDITAGVRTCNQRWIKRLEQLGAVPYRVVKYERGDGELREYTVPRRWIKLPYGPGTIGTAHYHNAAEWERRGVRIQRTSGDLPRSDRETAFNFNAAEQLAEVNTCRPEWHRRLEQCGAVPESIQVYEVGDGEFRWYLVPKSWIKLPANIQGRGNSANLTHTRGSRATKYSPETAEVA
jgi:hypothetical protein